jgi:pullulanase/glycogen debranching enzyme
MKKLVLLIAIILPFFLQAQQFSETEQAQGYAQRKDSVYFIFKQELYRLSPKRVLVTGAFRGWTQDLKENAWDLKKAGSGLWLLGFENFQFRKIAPASPFKFRTDEGNWMTPPSESPNIEAGNLIFMKGIQPPVLKAEIQRSKTIWAQVKGTTRPLDRKMWKLSDAFGNEIPIASVLPNDSSHSLITPAIELDIRRVYYLEIPSLGLRSHCSFDGWMRDLYSDKELGANVDTAKNATSFRVFAPRALKMIVYLYKQANDSAPYEMHDMEKDKDGVWEKVVPGDLHGTWYDFTVHGHPEPGNFFFETHPFHISDPYARVVEESDGKARVWHKTKAAKPLAKGRPAMKDLISYEVHVEDFTNRLPVSTDLKGSIPAMIQSGLKNKQGQKIGFDHLSSLGINAVHLMPMQEYFHYPDAEWQVAFKNDPWMKEQGIDSHDYNWGYMTSHAFSIESKYRKKGTEAGAQRDQFRNLVQAFHDKGIAVIVDFVFNHTLSSKPERDYLFHFDALDRQYYYRTKDLKLIGEYGNETKSENRPMVQRWILDQFRHFINEFGVDGFRIDLAGQTDQQTLKMLREELGPDVIIYGEPWIASNDPDYESNPDWDWYKQDAPICYFDDDARNAFKGPVSNPENKKTDRGFAGGNPAERENAMRALRSGFPDEKTPLSGIKYLDIHDNWALADQFALNNWNGLNGVDEDAFKIAATLLFTTSGPVVLHGGTEFMRSKGLAKLKEIEKQTAISGPMQYHGKRDTYNMRTANEFVWENVGLKKGQANSKCDFDGMLDFWKGMIALRNSAAGSVFRIADKLPENHYRFFTPPDPFLLGYLVGDKVLVLLNSGEINGRFTGIEIPKGKWKLVAEKQKVKLSGIKGKNLAGGLLPEIEVPHQGLGIWIKE